ncbi:hypothetical protein [Lapidilactobacillus luobeiensis]|uniref:hypothetical protein n=1 Tax=Lapidilactobacillus luobeiensis TaxID=2950371 RepID=UPI0021C4A5F3|nr:hypothetical protein [Lapidilactobacillus luobeiensis]
MTHHQIMSAPMPNDNSAIYLNEPWLLDQSNEPQAKSDIKKIQQPDTSADNVRVYIPLDLNRAAILGRLDEVISRNGVCSEANELDYSLEVAAVISRLEIYDQVHFRHDQENGLAYADRDHSQNGQALAQKIIAKLAEIPDGGAESFPFDLIAELKVAFG